MVEELEGRVSAAVVSRAFHAEHLGTAWAVRSTTAGVAAAAEDKAESSFQKNSNENNQTSDAKKKKDAPPRDATKSSGCGSGSLFHGRGDAPPTDATKSSGSISSKRGFGSGSLFHGRGVGKSKRYYISKVKSGEFNENCSDDFFNGGLDSPATSPPRNALLDSPPAGAYKAVLGSDFGNDAPTSTLTLGSSSSGSSGSNRPRSGSQPQKGAKRGAVRVVIVGRGQTALLAAHEESVRTAAAMKKKKKQAPPVLSCPASVTASVQLGAPVLRRLGLRATPLP